MPDEFDTTQNRAWFNREVRAQEVAAIAATFPSRQAEYRRRRTDAMSAAASLERVRAAGSAPLTITEAPQQAQVVAKARETNPAFGKRMWAAMFCVGVLLGWAVASWGWRL